MAVINACYETLAKGKRTTTNKKIFSAKFRSYFYSIFIFPSGDALIGRL